MSCGASPLGFTDNFNRGSLGQDWIYSTARNASGNDSFGSAAIAANQLNFVHVGGSNASSQVMVFIPRKMISVLYKKPQFAQMTWISGSALSRTGLAAGYTIQAGPDTGYFLSVDQGGQTKLRRMQHAADLVDVAILDALASGDVLKIGIVPGASANLIYCYRNRTLMAGVGPYVDMDAARPRIFGWSGISSDGLTLTGGAIWDNFSCGIFTP